jgi:hypothetical protein
LLAGFATATPVSAPNATASAVIDSTTRLTCFIYAIS